MKTRYWYLITITVCFLLLGTYILLSDANHKAEVMYSDVRVQTYRVYSDWYRFIGLLRGLPTTTEGLAQSLSEAEESLIGVEKSLEILKRTAASIDEDVYGDLTDFLVVIKAGLVLGRDIIDTGKNLLAQPDFPKTFREGRISLASIMGKDAVQAIGPSSAYQYSQLIRQLKGLNSLFDRIYSIRLDTLMVNIDFHLTALNRLLIIFRISLFGATAGAVLLLILQLTRLNRYLHHLAESTMDELTSTQSHLSEVSDYLRDARYQQSLFEMTAGISHELNTPLGNAITMSSFLGDAMKELRNVLVSYPDIPVSPNVLKDIENFELLDESLQKMKLRIDTFKSLSAVEHVESYSSTLLSDYVDDDIVHLARYLVPGTDFHTILEPGRETEIYVNSRVLNRILTQLIENTRDHADARMITIRFRVNNGQLSIDYSDNGRGVPQDTIIRISEPFYTTARNQQHMGLGLPIIISLISHKLQGSIVLHSEGSGLHIDMAIPLEAVHTEAAQRH